jgi:hypothetical protein
MAQCVGTIQVPNAQISVGYQTVQCPSGAVDAAWLADKLPPGNTDATLCPMHWTTRYGAAAGAGFPSHTTKQLGAPIRP